MKLTSNWVDTSESFRSATPGAGAGPLRRCGDRWGLTDSSAALVLAKKGARVVLLEAETIGNAATGRNGGMCNNGFAQDYGMLVAKLGKDVANRLYRAFDAGVDTVERLVAQEKIDCCFARVGKIKLAAKPKHYDKLGRSQELLAANVELLPWRHGQHDARPPAARRQAQRLVLFDGLQRPRHAHVNLYGRDHG